MKPRRLVSLLVAVCMMIAILPVSAFAENAIPTLGTDEFDYNGLRYKKLSSSTVTVVGPVRFDPALDSNRVIPETAVDENDSNKEYTVTEIAENAFSVRSSQYKSYIGYPNFISVTIPKTVTKIGREAFCVCGGYDNTGSFGLTHVYFESGSQLKTIEYGAFAGCYGMTEFEVPSEVETIGGQAFYDDWSIKTFTFQEGSKLKSIGELAFHCNGAIQEIILPDTVTDISECAFQQCGNLKTIEIPNTVKNIGKSAFSECPNLKTVIYNGTADQWNDLINGKNGDVFDATGNDKFKNPETLKYRCTVTFDANGHGTAPETQQPYKGDALDAFEKPTAAGYTFAGWYDEDGNLFDVTSPVEKDMKLTAKWEKIPDHTLAVSGGTFTVDGTEVDGETAEVQEGAAVEVTFKKDFYADSNLVFDGWKIDGLENAEDYENKETFAFTMPKNGVTIEARTKTETDDSGWDAGTVVTTAVLGTGAAVLAYHIGTEVYAEQVLGAGVAVPTTRGDVALKAWELAGKPAVENAAVASDEAAQAQQWVLENGLMANQKDGAFHPEKHMNKLKALRVLEKAQKLG